MSMKKVTVIAGVLWAWGLWAQSQPVNSITLQTAPPSPPASIGGRVTGFTGQGQTLYYWVVARYAAGVSVPQGPAAVPNTPGAGNLSASRFVTVSWPAVSGTTGYDVLRNTVPSFPASPSCSGCSVVLNTAALSVVDNGAALGAYPPAGLAAAQATFSTLQANGRDYTTPSLQVVKQPGGTQIIPTILNTPVAGQVLLVSQTGGGVNSTPGGSIPGAVPSTRNVNTSAPLGGGGNLSADRTLTCATCEVTTSKNIASGYAGLDAGGRVPFSETPGVERYSWALCGGVPCVIGADQANHVLVARTNTLTACYAQIKTAATGADIRLVINRQGADNVFTTFLAIPAASTAVVTELGFSANAALTPGQFLTMDLTQVGSIIPGQDLSVTCVGNQP